MATKTPISLMNELCKANNVVPEYQLVEESGPPHQKTFKMQLSLAGIGTYDGVGHTIKSAKHQAAQMGLESCGLTKPEKKPKQQNLAPSVQLNSLAMKLGQAVQYRQLRSEGKQDHGPTPVPSNAYSQYGQFRGYTRGYRRPPGKVTVAVRVGEKEYVGEGYREKEARHNAARNALLDLGRDSGFNVKMEKPAMNASPGMVEPVNDVKTEPVELNRAISHNSVTSQPRGLPIKSEISQVYEIAAQRKLPINFEVINSSGPPHSRVFETSVTVGEFKAVGEGPGKKVSKLKAAINILDNLKQLPPIIRTTPKGKGRLYNHGGYGKKTPKELDPSLNAISLLGQLRQQRKESLPEYTLVGEEGLRNKEFTIQVQVDSHTARGSGANKKEAKRNAAEAMLQLLGIRPSNPREDSGNVEAVENCQEKFSLSVSLVDPLNVDSNTSSSQATGSSQWDVSIEAGCMLADLASDWLFSELFSNSSSEDEGSCDRKQTMCRHTEQSAKKGHIYALYPQQKQKQDDLRIGEKERGSEGRQLPPGLLPILPEMASRSIPPQPALLQGKPQPVGPTVTVLNRAPGAPVGKPITEEILQNGSTPSMKKLQELAESGGFQIQYQNTTKGENNEQCLAVVTISTVPPLICRGYGSTLEAAFEHAAANALVPLIQPASPPNGAVIGEKGQGKAPGPN